MKKHFAVSGKTLYENLREYYDKVQPFDKHETELLALTKILSAVENSQGTSTNILITGQSGVGKDKLVSDAMKPFSPDKHFEFEHVTKKALTGLKMDYDKVSIHLNDVAPRIFDEESYLSLTTRNRGQKKFTVDYDKDSGHQTRELEGKPVIISTTNRISEVKPDHYRRHTNLKLFDNPQRKEQRTELMIDRTESPEQYKPSLELRNQLKDLMSIEYFVSIPFAKKLSKLYHNQNVPTNFTSHFAKILDYIRAYTILFHKEGEGKDKNGILYLVAKPEIYNEYVHPLITRIFSGEIQGLLGTQKKIYDVLKYNAEKKDGWTVNEIQQYYYERYGIMTKHETISKHLDNLSDDGIVSLDYTRVNEHNKRPILTCHFKNQDFIFPKFEELKEYKENKEYKEYKEYSKEGLNSSNSLYSPKNIYNKIEEHLTSLKDKEFDKSDFTHFISKEFTNRNLNAVFSLWLKQGTIFEFKSGRYMTK